MHLHGLRLANEIKLILFLEHHFISHHISLDKFCSSYIARPRLRLNSKDRPIAVADLIIC